MKKDIVIVDSGIFSEHPKLVGSEFVGINIRRMNGKIMFDHDLNDNIGHGTGIYSIISGLTNNKNIYIIKIYQEKLVCDIEVLISALQYIYDNIEAQIINLSIGSIVYNAELEDICNKIRTKGMIIISAFDNNGGISYPAAFDSVCGVASADKYMKANQFILVKNSPVNVLTYNGISRMFGIQKPWYIVNQGTSFSTAKFSAYIYNNIKMINEIGLYSFLEKAALEVYGNQYANTYSQNIIPFKIKRAAVIPFNKETHSLYNFREILDFEIVGFYDVKYRINEFNNTVLNSQAMVEDYVNIHWNDIDTLIIGHLSEINNAIQKDIKRELMEKCLQYRKNVFCFDDVGVKEFECKFKDNGLNLHYPKKNAVGNKDGKLYYIEKPILGVFGTATWQGKFTTQLIIRNRLLKMGYRVGQIGTEPSAPLFGMDDVYAFGYESVLKMSDYEFVESVNNSLHEIEKKEIDIIIAGSQSGTIPEIRYNIEQLHLKQLQFLQAINPDGVILCVNVFDKIFYIKRTINVIENLCNCKVFACVISPLKYKNEWQMINAQKEKVEEKEANQFKMELENKCNIKSYMLWNENHIDNMIDEIINFFS